MAYSRVIIQDHTGKQEIGQPKSYINADVFEGKKFVGVIALRDGCDMTVMYSWLVIPW